MHHEVVLTQVALRDLEDILDYVAAHDVPGKDDYLLGKIEEVIESLADFLERGSHPKELLALGIREYRQALFKPYRLIYQLTGRTVAVLLVADDRRDIQALMARRLLAAG